MIVDVLRERVTAFFATHASSLGLNPDALVVDYVLNWGGFVNYSYRIRDGRRAFHLKLSASADDQAALRRWMTLAPLLEPYHAPPILDWVDVGPAAGLLFPSLPGSPPTLNDLVLGELLPVLRALNADRDLAAALQPPRTNTARDAYLSSFHDRFNEDLRGISASRPPFVGVDLLGWLEDEVNTLSQRIARSSAFAEPLSRPVHGDLWVNNILWVGAEDWFLVDWDDVRIGDPVADLASLLGPTAGDPRPLKMLDRLEGQLTTAESERLQFLGRATLLDWVIDPLSDWIDAETAAEYVPVVREEKARVHQQALACYRELYR
jgi:hypothetical protein